jgi:tetratricopeptide (TPR) repeat protein
MFTDMVESTAQRARLGDSAGDALRREHDAIVERTVHAFGGVLVKSTGDGAMAAFSGASDAIATAVRILQAIERRNREHSEVLGLRVGVSLGDLAAEGDDLFGLAVNEAARLCALASSGEIVISDVVRVVAGSRVDQELVDRGEIELKGLPSATRVWGVRWSPAVDEPLPFPSLLGRARSLQFAGRRHEMALMEQVWQSACQGHAGSMLVSGEPGIGKTRLASELAEQAHREGALVLYGRCTAELGMPYQPVAEALGWFCDHVADARFGRSPDELARLDKRVPSSSEPVQGDPETAQYRLFEAVASWLEEVAESRPVMLVLDDLHWATRPTLLLVRHVIEQVIDARVCVVATYRNTDLDPQHALGAMLADFRRVPSIERIALDGLGPKDVRTLLGPVRSEGGDDRASDLAAAIHAETEGNPFFVNEVVRHLADTGVLQPSDFGWTTSVAVADVGIPEGVKEVVGQRLKRLGDEASVVLQGASVAGRDFTVAEVTAASDIAEPQVIAALEKACAAQLVAEVAADRFRFSHALVQSALADGISTTRRLRMHRAIAVHLEAADPTDVADLAYHWCAASGGGDIDKAVEFSLEAAAQATQRSAYDDAVSILRRAVEIVRDDEATRLRLLLELGAAEVATGDPEQYQRTFQVAAELATRLGDHHGYAKSILGYLGRDETILELDGFARPGLERALAAIDRRDEPALVCELLSALAAGLANFEHARADELSAEALQLARQRGDARVFAGAARVRLRCYWDPLAVGERLALVAELRSAGTETGQLDVVAQSWQWEAVIQFECGDMERVEDALCRIDEINMQLGLKYFRWVSVARRAGIALSTGALADAEVLIDEAAELAVHNFSIAHEQQAILYWLQGRAADAETVLLSEQRSSAALPVYVLDQARVSLFAAEAGDEHRARSALTEVASYLDRAEVFGLWRSWASVAAARAARLIGGGPWLDPLVAALEPLAGLFAVANPGTSSLGAIDGARGALALVAGRVDTAIELLSAAVEQNRNAGLMPFVAIAEGDLAEALASRDALAARTHAMAATRLANDIGMTHVVRQVQTLLTTKSPRADLP